MSDDWDNDNFSSEMEGLSISNAGINLGRGRGFNSVSNTQNDFSVGKSSFDTNNNGDDDWVEDDQPATNGGSYNSYSNGGNSYSGGGSSFGNSRGGGGNGCFNCGESGHMSRECPNPKKSSGRGCFKCGEEGHMSRDCPSGGGGGGRSNACFKCGEEGHISRDCPSGGGGGGGRSNACFKCGEEGHMSRECPSGGGGGGGNSGACFKCGESGHMARDCSMSGGGGGGGGGRACFKCNEEGHMAKDCPNGGTGDGDKPAPSTYEPEETPNDEEHLFSTGINSGIHFDKYDNIKVKMSGNNLVKAISTFKDAKFTEQLLENVRRANYIKPTPIQKCALPIILQGRDLMGCAQTGSGKTAAFLLPMIEYMLRENVGAAEYKEDQEPSAIIVAPTRELAIQIHNEARKFAYRTDIQSVVVYGGTAVNFQLSNLMNGCHILVATPGRLMDFINRGKIKFDKLKFLVLDEADRMLDMGFLTEVKKLCAHAALSSVGLQTLMFSATFPSEIQNLAGEFLNDYIFLAIGQVGGANSDVKQVIYQVSKFDKRQKLVDILQESPNDRTLVFVEQKKNADFLATYLCQKQFRTTSIHGDRLQREREEALADFRSGRMPILTATAVAARGLDIRDVQHVINYDMPSSIDEYVHRIGRTGRLGNEGKATSFYDASSDSGVAGPLVKILSDSLQEVPDWLLSDSSNVDSSNFGGAGRGRFGARDVRSQSGQNSFGQNNGMQDVVTSAPDEEEWG